MFIYTHTRRHTQNTHFEQAVASETSSLRARRANISEVICSSRELQWRQPARVRKVNANTQTNIRMLLGLRLLAGWFRFHGLINMFEVCEINKHGMLVERACVRAKYNRTNIDIPTHTHMTTTAKNTCIPSP